MVGSRMMGVRAALLLSALACSSVLMHSGVAQAEEPGINPRGKGITGGALLGGELVLTVEAAAGVKPTWAYLVGGIGGAALGGVGGYFVENGDSPKPAYYLLAAGMALVIPTTVAVLQATSYKPPADYTEERTVRDAAPGATDTRAPEAPGTTPTLPAKPEATPAPSPAPGTQLQPTSRQRVAMSLVDLDSGSLRLGVPIVEVLPMYNATELKKYGVEQRTEVRLPVFQATF